MGARHHILILGGTTEARQLAERLAEDGRYAVTLSLAGRTETPRPLPVPVRIGGFGGVEGLVAYLKHSAVTQLIDATHPYAARISANAEIAAGRSGVPLLVLRRPGWAEMPGDRWRRVSSVADAVAALGSVSRRVFLAIGRQEASLFEQAPQHHYLVRSVDPIVPRLDLPHARFIEARGPFPQAEEHALLLSEGIEAIVAKNSGGTATYGKLAAARALGIEVILVDRPPPGTAPRVGTIEAALDALAHGALFS
ncbi:cobalt-precorrin-6A reductase [Xaviernesmea oryzae]|uniref:Cobalt-precorrin-6A reductase n=1 Tax=Xaviernesmea oryzae TaxID=464029 RepID=A0A1Q9AZ43_9HYPH|nr:cobalt-precorrin-6A reductase [Xaviernesmea oryzae]OLP60955.1 cobalt-precorrin-6A reductase [Xaviernesmea oryzae]SEL20153.1 precorrin-6A/cobalt-precorrin-6A reductase [Xaviernesmea oryzae]